MGTHPSREGRSSVLPAFSFPLPNIQEKPHRTVAVEVRPRRRRLEAKESPIRSIIVTERTPKMPPESPRAGGIGGRFVSFICPRSELLETRPGDSCSGCLLKLLIRSFLMVVSLCPVVNPLWDPPGCARVWARSRKRFRQGFHAFAGIQGDPTS